MRWIVRHLRCYSVAPSGAGAHPGLLAQLLLSVTSLRQHNRLVPIVIFDFGALPPKLRRDLQRLGAFVRPRGSYEACLAQMTPHWQTLSLYVDEGCLQIVSAAEDANFVAPFNIGVMLLNEALVRGASGIERLMLSYAWRFLVWIAAHAERLGPGCLAFHPVVFLRRQARQLVGPADLRLALPYPSRNWWILDQVSLWSAFGHMRGLRCGDFAPTDVVQGGEFLSNDSAGDHAVLCHYFSSNMNRFTQWLHSRRSSVSAVSSEQKLPNRAH